MKTNKHRSEIPLTLAQTLFVHDGVFPEVTSAFETTKKEEFQAGFVSGSKESLQVRKQMLSVDIR